MKSNISLKWTFMIVGVVGIACLSLVLFIVHLDFPISISYAQSIPANVLKTGDTHVATIPVTRSGIPTRITIPSIHVDAKIESVGLTKQGEVGIPKGPTNTAWFNLSARPGEIGSAIIVGHYGRWANGIQTVFNHLGELKKGDKLFVEDNNKNITTFVVRESRTFISDADAQAVFNAQDSKSHMNLITCEGIWNKLLKRYPRRLVVFTDKE